MDVKGYLEEKAAAGEREWLRREPRTTHPRILALVREAVADGLFYDDDVNRYVNERVDGLSPHERHPASDPLVSQLGHEVYIARACLRDEAAARELRALEDEGYQPLDPDALKDGARLLVRFGTRYSGQEVPTYDEAREVRVRKTDTGIVLLPKGARSHGFPARTPALMKVGDDA